MSCAQGRNQRAGFRRVCAEKNPPFDFRQNPSCFCTPVRRPRPRSNERPTGVRVGVRIAGHTSQRACRPLVDSVAARVVVARTTERRDEKVNSAACAEGRVAPWLQKRACPRSEIRHFYYSSRIEQLRLFPAFLCKVVRKPVRAYWIKV